MSEDLDLNNVASEAMGESKPQETTINATDTNTIKTVSPEKAEIKTASKVEKPGRTDNQEKLSRRATAAKEFSDFRLNAEKKERELQNRISNQEKEFEPLKPFISEIKKALELKKQQEEAQKYQQNPQAANEERMQQMIQQAVQPFQQQIEQQQSEKFINDSLSYVKTLAGSEESFKALSPYMKQVLDNTIKTSPEDADRLARNPEVLFAYSKYLHDKQNGAIQAQQTQQQEIDNQKSKAEMAKFNGGISKPNRTAKIQTSNSRDSARTNAYDFIKELTGQK